MAPPCSSFAAASRERSGSRPFTRAWMLSTASLTRRHDQRALVIPGRSGLRILFWAKARRAGWEMETQGNRRKSQKREKDTGELFQACGLALARQQSATPSRRHFILRAWQQPRVPSTSRLPFELRRLADRGAGSSNWVHIGLGA